jgi:hypothetical protein
MSGAEWKRLRNFIKILPNLPQKLRNAPQIASKSVENISFSAQTERKPNRFYPKIKKNETFFCACLFRFRIRFAEPNGTGARAGISVKTPNFASIRAKSGVFLLRLRSRIGVCSSRSVSVR